MEVGLDGESGSASSLAATLSGGVGVLGAACWRARAGRGVSSGASWRAVCGRGSRMRVCRAR
jgi:hypothetical protein